MRAFIDIQYFIHTEAYIRYLISFSQYKHSYFLALTTYLFIPANVDYTRTSSPPRCCEKQGYISHTPANRIQIRIINPTKYYFLRPLFIFRFAVRCTTSFFCLACSPSSLRGLFASQRCCIIRSADFSPCFQHLTTTSCLLRLVRNKELRANEGGNFIALSVRAEGQYCLYYYSRRRSDERTLTYLRLNR